MDRRASKNRKIRYILHEKIANFMAPIDALEPEYSSKADVLKFMFGQATDVENPIKKKKKTAKGEDVSLI